MNHISKLIPKIAFCALAAIPVVITGCQTADSDAKTFQAFQSINHENSKATAKTAEGLILHEGDIVRVTFPGSPNLNNAQPIRRDGKITLELAGEVTAAGLTPVELEKEILRLCGPQLVTKEVVVSVDSSSFPVFVTGAVVRPGKIMSDRPITALQAIMESGGFDYSKANLTSVRVIRQDGSEMKNFKVNLKLVLQGKQSEPFNLKPADIVYVPEKFTWF